MERDEPRSRPTKGTSQTQPRTQTGGGGYVMPKVTQAPIRGFDESIHQPFYPEGESRYPLSVTSTSKPTPKVPRELGPCKGCGAPNKHKTADGPELTKEQCPLREHPDWNHADCEFANSVAGRRMKDDKITHINKLGAPVSGRGFDEQTQPPLPCGLGKW